MRSFMAQQAVANTSRKVLISLFALLFVIALIINVWEVVDIADFLEPHDEVEDRSIISEAKSFSSSEDSAYVFLALGPQANQMNCPAAIESLVRYAGWSGDVYMITDRPQCFNSDEIISNAGMKADKFHLSVVDEQFGSGGYDYAHPAKVGLRKSRARSFTMKTRIFDYIDDRIMVAAYVDCDMIFAIEGCAKAFIESGPAWGKNARIKFGHVKVSEEVETYGEILGVHAGTMVAHRRYSADALAEWRKQMEQVAMEGDNDAYFEAYTRIKNEIGIAAHPMQPAELNMGIEELSRLDNRYEKFLDPLHPRVFCMNHISKARCVDYGREAVQRFVDRFQLRTYEGKYPYCVHSIFQPVLYGWIPVSYLPICPKLETIL